jgi:cell division protein FtsB
MTQSSARTMPVGTGDMAVPGGSGTARLARKKSSTAGRRRWLMLSALVVLVVVAILANIGPLTHYQAARARLDKATAQVDALETQKAQLEGELAKLSETSYLETLAREQLSYVRPGEELYIVANSSGEAGDRTDLGAATGASQTPGSAHGTATATTAGPGIGAAAVSSILLTGDTGEQSGADSSAAAPSATSNTEGARAGQSPGILEKVLSAIRGLF